MLIKVDNETVLELTERDKKIMQYNIRSADFDSEIKRRATIAVAEKLARCEERLISDNIAELKRNHAQLPSNASDLVDMIFALPSYKNRDERDAAQAAIPEIVTGK